MSGTTLSPAVVHTLCDAKARLAKAFGERLRKVRLYGSVARAEAGPDSDIDVLVVLDEVHSLAERVRAMEVVADIALEHDLPIEPLVMDEAELARLRRLETALA